MSILSALTTLLLFSGSAISQIVAPSCSGTTPYDWASNTLNQGPCLVAAYLLSTSNNGSWVLAPLTPGSSYPAPSTGINKFHACKCTTVVYSLLSACAACQGGNWTTWSKWALSCTEISPPSTFPNAVPAGTCVPQWALLDVTLQDDWSSAKSMATGDLPEIGPGALIGTSGSVTSSAAGAITVSPTVTSSHSSSPSKSSGPSSFGSSNSKTGTIVGSVIGGVAVIAIAIFGTFYLRRRRSKASSAPSVVDGASQSQNEVKNPLWDAGTQSTQTPSTPASETAIHPMRLYDPDDPTTFPGYQAPHAPDTSTQSPVSPDGAGNTQANKHTSQPLGYHGLPTV